MAQKNNGEKLRVFTGGASKAIKWHQIYKDDFCIVEVIATVVSIQRNANSNQEIILVRDKSGPILQVIHYQWDHSEIDAIQVGQIIRCVGRMQPVHRLRAFYIREATSPEISTLQKMGYICDHAIDYAIRHNDKSNN